MCSGILSGAMRRPCGRPFMHARGAAKTVVRVVRVQIAVQVDVPDVVGVVAVG